MKRKYPYPQTTSQTARKHSRFTNLQILDSTSGSIPDSESDFSKEWNNGENLRMNVNMANNKKDNRNQHQKIVDVKCHYLMRKSPNGTQSKWSKDWKW